MLPALLLSIAVTVSSSPELPADGAVVAQRRGDAPGFWVPRETFRALERAYETLPAAQQRARLLELEVEALRAAHQALARSSSAAVDLAELYRRAYLDEQQAHARTRGLLVELAVRGPPPASPESSSMLREVRDVVGLVADGAILALIAAQATR